MRCFVVLVIACLVAAALAQRAIKEADGLHIPHGWVSLGDAPADHRLKLHVMMKMGQFEVLDAMLAEISDPRNARYGQWLSREEVIELVKPTQETREAVEEWLSEAGIAVTTRYDAGDMLTIEPTVAEAEKLLHTHFVTYEHSSTGHVLVKADAPYSVPSDLDAHIDLVVGVVNMPQISRGRQSAPSSMALRDLESRQAALIGPAQLRARYNVTTYASNANNSMAVAEFQAQYYSPKDLTKFFSKYVNASFSDDAKIYKVIGTNNPNAPGVEAELDVQYIMGVSPGVNTWFYSYPSMAFFDDVTQWLSYLANQTDLPLVHSVSYGDQTSSQPSSSYKQKTDQQFAAVTARGASMIIASGDSGSGCDFCIWLQPSYPATSPYVLSVGATQFISGSSGPEEAVTAFSSGGGFAWAENNQPSWQKDVVQNYISKYTSDLPFGFMYNKNGRATPDVSALGIGFSVIVAGAVEDIGGTSASTPTFSAIVSLLNDHQLNQGKSSLGFLPPLLYQMQANVTNAFFDVTEGSDTDSCCFFPFKCAPGWDAVTGLGTPNFEVMVQNLP